ncbi:cytochrome P450 monooxygenase [Fusarium napiforme]|uniref:Cytochrome P450 monooxygenase n=1 Tax=Fusarium napiforme TaxID=42672 RepID=A0A8H5J3F1_9HYPO|nr:cytochrome P450 monooxygenase [Fusarium napiforme]
MASALAVEHFAQIGQMPFLDRLLGKNPIVRIGSPDMNFITSFTVTQLQRHLEQQERDEISAESDFLDQFVDGMTRDPDTVDVKLIINFLLANILAGADTTAILKNEIVAQGFDDGGVVPYSIARSLPYLDAVIRESLRMHLSVAMPLERYVPETGLTLPDGSFVPPGVAVGLNPYIIGRNKEVWGEDADEFRPERWPHMGGRESRRVPAAFEKDECS